MYHASLLVIQNKCICFLLLPSQFTHAWYQLACTWVPCQNYYATPPPSNNNNNKTRSRPIETLSRNLLQPRPVVSLTSGTLGIRHTDLLRDRSGCITTAVFHTPIASYLIVATWKATSLLNFPRDVGITIIVSCATKTARNITRIAK